MTSPADHRKAATLGQAGSPGSGDRSLTVAFLHLAPELGALDPNRALIEHGTRVAADSGADWVLSGELVVPGYRFEPLIGTNWIAGQPDSWMRRLARLSCDLGVTSFVSHPERDAVTGKLFNSLFVLGRNGQILGRQRKLDPTPGSEDWATRARPASRSRSTASRPDSWSAPTPASHCRSSVCATPARSCSSHPRLGGQANGGRKASGKRGRSTPTCR